MPVPITHRGNDDLTLAQVIADGSVDVELVPGSTHRNIERAAAAVEVELVQSSDLNMIEQLAAALSAAYVFGLDDDGTLAAALSVAHLATTPPDYFAYSYELQGGVAGGVVGALSARALTNEGSFPRPGTGVVVIGECVITASPPFDHPQRMGIAALFTFSGAPTATVSAGFIKLAGEGQPLAAYYNNAGEFGPNDPPPLSGETVVGRRVGMYIDNTGQVGWTVDGLGDQGAIPGAVLGAGGRYSPALYVDDFGGGSPTIPGDIVAGRLYLDAPDLECVYPVGAVDRNGDPVGA